MINQNGLTDEKLIQFYLNGDPNAMATLVELYKDRVYRSIYNIVQDKYVAEGIFQEVFISLINNMIAGKFTEEDNFLRQASRIAQNLCIEYSRKSMEPQIAGSQEDDTIRFTASAPVLPGSNYHENHGKIKSLIDLLPGKQREVLVLNHYGGLGYKEIAEIMKCTLNTALDNMKYGLTNLRKMMIEKEMVLTPLTQL